MNRVVLAVLGCALALGSIAAGPAPAPAAKPAAPQATQVKPPPHLPPLAPLSSDDPAKVEMAKQFIIAYHPRLDLKNVKKVLDNFIPRAVAAYEKRDPNFDARKYEAETRERVTRGATKKVELQSHIVSRHFTMAELRALAAFFNGPLGSKLVNETPLIQRDMLRLRREMGKQFEKSSYQNDSGGDDEDDEDEDDSKPAKPAPSKALAKPAVTAPAKPAAPKSK